MDFFHQATMRICGSLDIDTVLSDCLGFFKQYIPAIGIQMSVYDEGLNAIISFAKVSEPKKARIDINACAEEILSVLEHQMQKSGVRVDRRFDPDLPLITADDQMLKQVFMNLLLNASQATPKGGRITLTSVYEKINNRLAIEISDTGTGISEKFIDRIFDPFFTTKGPGKGTGLGLSVSYGIVKQHGGEIEVESAPGKGTTFTVRLPVERDTED